MFIDVFLGVLCALLASQLIGWLIFLIWWHQPFRKEPDDA